MNKSKKLTIAVTGLNNAENPGSGIPVIRGLKNAQSFEAKIIGLAYENLEPGIYMHELIDKTYHIPYPSANSDELLERIQEIHQIEKIDVLIPNFEAELVTFMKAEEFLEKIGIKTFLPKFEQFEERYKTHLPSFGQKYQVNVPNSITISSYNDIPFLNKKFTFPLLVKGKTYDAYTAYNIEQIYLYFDKISSKWGLPIIIQEYIKGTEVNVVALGDGKGNTIGAVPMKKQSITEKGKAWAGISLNDEKLLEITKNIIYDTKWRGGMELEMIKSQKNEYFLIEINPRIPAWVYLAIGAGQNIPEALVNLALGNHVESFKEYEIGKIYLRYSYDMVVDFNKFQKLVNEGEL